MSVIVRGMEMPQNCAYCPLSEYRNTSLGQILDCKRIGTVGTALRDTYDVLNRRHPNCPLIELPPHGRLIDKDKLRHDLFVNFNGERIPFYDCDNFPTKISYRDLHSILAEQKTVIEAEGETDA